jgi:uncharacterized protein
VILAATAYAPKHAPLIGMGEVRHTRLRPKHHAFDYPTYFLMLPLRSMAAAARDGSMAVGGPKGLAHNRRGLLSFHDTDHGDGRASALDWLLELLQREGVTDADGEVWLQTYPRVLGYTFKPVSFWYCHRADGSLRAVVVEVNNTFGERHCYILDGTDVAWGHTLHATKVFHVSPFCSVAGTYRFRFMRVDASKDDILTVSEKTQTSAGRVVARIEHDDDAGPLILTSLSGALSPLTAQSARRAFWSTPLMTFGVVARIHWHALQLWFKRVPFHTKPAPPGALVSR